MPRRPARYPAELREEAVRVVAKPAHPGDFDFTAHDHASASKACDIKNSYTLRSVLDKPGDPDNGYSRYFLAAGILKMTVAPMFSGTVEGRVSGYEYCEEALAGV